MQVCVFTEPHRGATYDTQLRFARHVEECGFTGFFRADHYQQFGDSDGLPGPTDAWVTLAGLARETSRIRLGTLVTCATFRLPGPLAIIVAQVDQMSGGRVELGIGAGWYEREHTSYGIPFPPAPERVSRMTEQLAVITGLWRTPVGQTFSHTGEFYTLVDAPALPKPVQQPHPPVIVGGKGPRRTPEAAARYADEYNAVFLGPAEARAQFARVREACERVGRDTTAWPLRLSSGIPLACGRTDAEARRRAERLHEPGSALPPGEAPLVGTPEQLVERIGEYAEAGAERVYLRVGDMTDLDQLELVAAEVLPKLG
ncbi:MAG TPA: LLM class F420-dependent oxidoreductase [Natronosporangium sp.]|nr:LLM class F420-dependent oxidoreductase [Natronosporangium sp.]